MVNDSRKLTNKLKEHGLSISPREKKALLSYAPSTRSKKIAGMIRNSVAQIAANSLYTLLSRINGVSSTRSYVIAAIKGADHTVAIRNLGSSLKIKFYPTAAAWDTDPSHMHQEFGANDFQGRSQYQRCFISKDQAEKFIAWLNSRGDCASITLEGLNQVFDGKEPGTEFIVPPKTFGQRAVAKPRVVPQPEKKHRATKKTVAPKAKVLKKRPSGYDPIN